MGLQAGGAASSMIGAYSAAQGQRANANAQAGIDDTNARLAELGAKSVLQQGAVEQNNSRLRTAALKSRQKVSLAANGVDLGEGTAARLLTSTDVVGSVEADAIAADAVMRAFGYSTQAGNYRTAAGSKRANAEALSPGLAGVSSLLGSSTQLAASWYQLSKSGVNASPQTAVTGDGWYPNPQAGP